MFSPTKNKKQKHDPLHHLVEGGRFLQPLRAQAAHQPKVLTFRVDGGDAFGGADVPDANGLVSGRCDEQVRVGRMPAQLIHTVAVTSVVVLFHLETVREPNPSDHRTSTLNPQSDPLL